MNWHTVSKILCDCEQVLSQFKGQSLFSSLLISLIEEGLLAVAICTQQLVEGEITESLCLHIIVHMGELIALLRKLQVFFVFFWHEPQYFKRFANQDTEKPIRRECSSICSCNSKSTYVMNNVSLSV